MDALKQKTVAFLHWTEKYTKTDMVYLAKGMGWLSGGEAVSALASFLFALAVANLLPKETYGVYKFILSLTVIISIPTLGGMTTSVTRSVARGFDGALKAGVTTRLRWGVLASIGALGVSGYYFIQGNTELTLALLVVAIFMPPMEAFATYQAFLSGKKRFDFLTRYEVISQVAAYGILIATILLTDSLLIILLAYFLPWTILRATFLQLSQKHLVTNTKTESSTISYGKHLSLMAVLGTIANNLDKILLFHFLGAAQVAVYSIAVALPEQIKGPLKNIGSLALPKFSEGRLETVGKAAWKKIWLSISALGLISLAYILVAPLLFDLFFPAYKEAIFLSQVFSLSLVSVALFIPISILQAFGKTRELYIFNISSSSIQLILTVACIYFFGLLGAILAWVIARLFNLCASLIILRYVLRQST